MKSFIIVKASRDSNTPYIGISCDAAGIEKGKIYKNKKDALQDAKALTIVNPVGFFVKEYRGKKK